MYMGKKQINSRKGVYDGVKFASQLEIHCYKLLQEAGILEVLDVFVDCFDHRVGLNDIFLCKDS